MFGAHLVLLLWPFCMFVRKISKEVGMTDQSIRWYVLNDGQRCFWPKILLHLYTHYTNDLSFFFLSLIFNCIYFYPMYVRGLPAFVHVYHVCTVPAEARRWH